MINSKFKIQISKLRNSLFILILLCIIGCGDYNEGENYPELSSSQAGLALSETIHPTGWGKPECFLCHNIENLHLDRANSYGIDFSIIRDQVESGTACATCHGSNGAGFYYGTYR